MSHILTRCDAGVGVITINRPQAYNSLDVATAQDLRRAALKLARDEQIRVVMLRGIDGVFCSGADLKQVRSGGAASELSYLRPADHPAPKGYGAVFKQILEYLHSTISEIRRAPKPFVAAVDGIAAAGGFGLAMACDLVVASERASFEWAYSRTGLTGAESSTFFLPRLIGLRRAMELVLLNPRLDARRALEYGLITAVYPMESFGDEVHALARRLAEGPTHAYAIAKGLLHTAAGLDRLDEHLDAELENLTRVAGGEEFAVGLQAFFEKEAPSFSGR